jgi:hypothetical protein
MSVLQLFEWGGFKHIDLYGNWEVLKVQKLITPKLIPAHSDILDSRISDLYANIFTYSKWVTKGEISSHSDNIYNLLKETNDYLNRDIVNFIEEEDTNLMDDLESITPAMLLDIAHEYLLQDTNYDQYNSKEDYLTLSLMLIDQYLGHSGELKFIFAFDALNCFSVGFASDIYKSKISQEAKRKASLRHSKSNKVKQYAIQLMNKVKSENTEITNPNIAKMIEEEVMRYSKEEGFIYTDRFHQTIYEWVLKYFPKK